jgi:uncharacterized protein (TIGR02231 family)
MKIVNILLMCTITFILTNLANAANDENTILSSKIVSVKLYQNQAQIIRHSKISLTKGQNIITLGGLPKTLYDWSVKGRLPKEYSGKILSVEIEQKALLNKRQRGIVKIEKILEELRERDLELLDDLKSIKSQQTFLDSILTFTNQTASKELATRLPQIKVWGDTLQYVTGKRKSLLAQTRQIEKKREEIGKNIQKWEFELSQIAGYSYFRNYQALNKVTLENRAAMNIQQFASIVDSYAERKKLLKEPTGKVEIEKRIIINIHSNKSADIDFFFSYIMPDTFWQMQYDVRASNENKKINLILFGNVYQKTGEDWNKVSLSLSTGSPVNVIKPPFLHAWYLDVYHIPKPSIASYDKKAVGKAYKEKYPKSGEMRDEEARLPEGEIKEKGPYVEIAMPLRQTILSSTKYQKKYIREYDLTGDKKIKFYYELIPSQVRSGFLKVNITNTTSLPWLPGVAQIFLENEFMGKADMPYTPKGKNDELVLGMETRLTAQKELLKKYEDTSGIFGGKRRILYKYKITIENQLPKKTEAVVLDVIPISRNKKIEVEIANLSQPFFEDDAFKETTEYARGVRKWKIEMDPHKRKEITYDIVITHDKDIQVRGIN